MKLLIFNAVLRREDGTFTESLEYYLPVSTFEGIYLGYEGEYTLEDASRDILEREMKYRNYDTPLEKMEKVCIIRKGKISENIS